jgi:hypothetical protein
VAGQIRLIVPAGVAVELVGQSFLGARSVRGRTAAAAPAEPVTAVIEVRTLTIGGSVKVIRVRRSRWRSGFGWRFGAGTRGQ